MSPSGKPNKTPKDSSDRRLRLMRERRDHRIDRVDNKGTRRKRRNTMIIGAVILILIAAVIGYGFYDAYVAPTQVLAARVGDKTYTQGDLVKRVRLMQSVASATDQPFELGRAPFQVLMEMAEAEVIRRGSPAMGVYVSNEHVDAQLKAQFSPRTPAGQEYSDGQLEKEYSENYTNFLNLNHLSDTDFRQIVEERIYRSRLRQKLGEQVPTTAEQIEINWIKITTAADVQSGQTPPNPQLIVGRLEEEAFGIVASEFNSDTLFSNRVGYVGWIPKGAFPDLDLVLFGDDDNLRIPLFEISEPIYSTDNSVYIVQVIDGPEIREISTLLREQMKNIALDSWINQQQEIGTSEGWWEVKFNSEIYAWVIDQVRLAAPRVTPTPTGQR